MYFTEKQRLQYTVAVHPDHWPYPLSHSKTAAVSLFRRLLQEEFRSVCLTWPELCLAWYRLIDLEIQAVDKKVSALERMFGLRSDESPVYDAERLDTAGNMLGLHHLMCTL
jgi:hypothetical protein